MGESRQERVEERDNRRRRWGYEVQSGKTGRLVRGGVELASSAE